MWQEAVTYCLGNLLYATSPQTFQNFWSHLKILGARRASEPQIFQNFWSHFKILGARRATKQQIFQNFWGHLKILGARRATEPQIFQNFWSHLKILGARRATEPQTFQNVWSHLKILGARRVTRSSYILRAQNSGTACELHSHLTLSARCMWTEEDTFLCASKRFQSFHWIYLIIAYKTKSPGVLCIPWSMQQISLN